MIASSRARQDDARQINIIRDLTEIDAIASTWHALEQRTVEQSTFFQSYAWCRAVVDLRQRHGSTSGRPFVLTVQEGKRLLAVWALALYQQGPCRVLRAIDDPFGKFAQPLIDPDVDQHAIVESMIDEIRRSSAADTMLMTKVTDRSPLRPALSAAGARVSLTDHAVYLDFADYADFETYFKTVNTKTRKNVRNARNRLYRDHQVDHEITTDREVLSDMIREAIDGRIAWMRSEGKTSPAFRDKLFEPLLLHLASCEPPVSLLGFRLKTATRSIATQWGFLHRNRYYAYLSARNRDFDQYSAGRLHLGMIIEACAERGIDRIEMMAPPSDYKLQWSKSLTTIDDFMLPLTSIGRLYQNLWHDGLREALKSTYYRLPDGLKKRLSQKAAV